MTSNDEYLKIIDGRLTIIERTVMAVEEQIAFLIQRGINQNEQKFPGGESQPGGSQPGDCLASFGN